MLKITRIEDIDQGNTPKHYNQRADRRHFEWTDESFKRLVELNNAGYTMSRIAEMLVEEFGGSLHKGGVIGKLHRTGQRKKYSRKPPREQAAVSHTPREPYAKPKSVYRPASVMQRGQGETVRSGNEQQFHILKGKREKSQAQTKRINARLGFQAQTSEPSLEERGLDEDGKLAPAHITLPEEQGGIYITDPALPRHGCRWPMGEKGYVCGEASTIGAYCKRHAQMAYRQPPQGRRMEYFWSF